ncbi:hypothetical protein JCM19238_4391 [Vibrio ponticus]|nr:hypothetical protein JCM19238_4391 [Vibrio ponticus]
MVRDSVVEGIMNRYQQLADLFKQQIQNDTWRAGERASECPRFE